MDREAVMARFLTGLPARFEPSTGDARLHGAIVHADEVTGRAVAIAALAFVESDLESLAERVARGEAAFSLP
jgi:calcineurin-like phosphoesterase